MRALVLLLALATCAPAQMTRTPPRRAPVKAPRARTSAPLDRRRVGSDAAPVLIGAKETAQGVATVPETSATSATSATSSQGAPGPAPAGSFPGAPSPTPVALVGALTVPPTLKPTPLLFQLPATFPARALPSMPSLVRPGIENDKTMSLTMRDAIQRALENNNDIEFARGNVLFAESQLNSIEGAYDPIFAFGPQLKNSVTPTADTLSGSDKTGTLTRNSIGFNSSVTRQLRTGGGQYQLFFNNTRDTTNSSFAQLNPIYLTTIGIQFTQPLLRDRALDKTRRDLRIQRKRLEQSDADFRTHTTDVIAQVQRAYWDLVFALRDQQNRVANLKLVRLKLEETETRIEIGSTAPIERAEVRTELSTREAEALIAIQNVTIAENNLKQLILRDKSAADWVRPIIPTDEPDFEDAPPVNLAEAIEEASVNRPVLRRLSTERDISDIDIAFYKNQLQPRVDLLSTLSTTGLAGSIPEGQSAQQSQRAPENLIGGYGQTLSNLFSLNTRSIVVSVRVELPLRNKTAKANLAGARIQSQQLSALTRAEEQSVMAEVRNAVQSVEISRQRVLVARAARENAELQLGGERGLYEVGRSTTFLLFQRENQLSAARNMELRAQTDYHKSLATLQQATGTTLRSNNVVIETSIGRD